MFTKKLWKLTAAGEVLLRGTKTLVASVLRGGSSTETFTATGDIVANGGDFSEPEANITYDTDHWKNTFDLGTNLAIGGTATQASSSGYHGTYPSIGAAVDGTLTGGVRVTNTVFDIDIDMGSIKTFNRITTYGQSAVPSAEPVSAIFQVGSDGTNFSTVATITFASPWITGEGQEIDFSDQTFRYIRVKYTGIVYTHIAEIEVYNKSPNSSTNTVKAKIPFTGTKNFVPETLTIKSETESQLVDGEVLVSWSDNNSTYSSEYGLTAFRALNKSVLVAKTNVWLRVRLVGAAHLATIAITTEGSTIEVGAAISAKVDGIEKVVINGNGLETIATTLPNVTEPSTPTDGVIAYSIGDGLKTKDSSAVVSNYSYAIQTLTDAANISWDAATGKNATVTLTTARILDLPTNMTIGSEHKLLVVTGGFALTFDAGFMWAGGTAPTVTTGSTLLAFEYDGTDVIGRVLAANYS
jgi:hypothetical protein